MGETKAAPVAKKVLESTVKESHFNEQEMKEIDEKFAAMQKEIDGLRLEKEEFAKAEVTAKEEADNKMKELFDLVEKLGEEPAAKPTEKKAKPFNLAEQKAAFKADLHKIR